MKRLIPLLALIAVVSCGGDDNPTTTPTPAAPYSQTDLVVGTGVAAISGNQVTVAYTGWLYDNTKPDGKGSQFETNPSFSFRLGTGAVIRGWDQGVPGMRVGASVVSCFRPTWLTATEARGRFRPMQPWCSISR